MMKWRFLHIAANAVHATHTHALCLTCLSTFEKEKHKKQES